MLLGFFPARTARNLACRCFSNNVDVVIAAAARTPVGTLGGQLAALSAPQLAAVAIELIMKQTAMPAKQLDAAILASRNVSGMGQAPARQAVLAANLPKEVCSTTLLDDGLKVVIAGIQMLQLNLASAVIAGSMESASNVPFHLQRQRTPYGGVTLLDGLVVDVTPLVNCGPQVKACDDEIAPVTLPLKRRAPPTLVTADEMDVQGHYDNAAAMLLMSAAEAQRLQIKPLARVSSYKRAPSVTQLLKYAEFHRATISKWIATPTAWRVLAENGVNAETDGMTASTVSGGANMLTQLIYRLRPGQSGCVLTTEHDTAMGLLVTKLAVPNLGANGKLPLFTLYTKDPCPLCDVLLEELQGQFPTAEDFVLEKIFITEKENVRFLRAYRFDIPVLFLNRQYLCMHRLDVDALRRRLDMIDNIK